MIKLENISKSFQINQEELTILRNVNLEIHAGEFVGILGRSGSGKSTLLNLIGFLDTKFSGNYEFEGKKVGEYSDKELSKIRNKNVGFIFQNFALIETMNVRQNIEVPLMYSGISKKKAHHLTKDCLRKVGLVDFESQSVRLLSGGQRQRVAIARSIITSPSFIIADEPTGALDSKTSKEIMDLFQSLNKMGVTIILVTHDESLTSYCNRVIHLLDGEVME
ncbi:ABC transporter ATP-binding protein [Periweissella fabalis]|uniref:ABC transporter ATP-binding protein n=1 Tax=Periweissella fabalis TaxID=1070421 RepID=A0A7X6N5H0_9LACO|nr:ABC transporter ATP-binding protein [Periweissella fabalis]MCM0598375.1 ABC transporter ATP-binding protein [Periweissella fabalis]NKZ25047.1 ABC transporter ATP-binding protein [Periweissella fabalis]